MFLKPTLRRKLLLLSVLLALIPLGLAGRAMITITQDELKSAANDEISLTADQLARQIDELYLNTWVAPLRLVRNALASGDLQGLATPAQDIVDLVWIQLDLEGMDPLGGPRDDFAARLEEAGLGARETLLILPDERSGFRPIDEALVGGPTYLDEVGSWILTVALPVAEPAPGFLSARFDLGRLRESLFDHPFNETGLLRLVDAEGRELFDPQLPDRTELELVRRAAEVLGGSGSRTIQVTPYTRPSGEKMLGGYAFPSSLDWAVVVERTEEDAYLAVDTMTRQLLVWVSVGLLVAVVGAIVFSGQISRPIVQIGQVVQEVGQGNFKIRVDPIRTRDEVNDLGQRINEMIGGLRERFELSKFVSGSTMEAISAAETSIHRGGSRQNATVFFSDIRGFTAFSEKVEPEVVVIMLNAYLSVQAEIVKEHGGDIDKFVGDEVVALFQGDDMVLNAARCAVEIQAKMEELNADHPEWDIAIGIGINTGDMIMGAMGSEDRMDYTILGDNVNLGARLCSAAGRKQTILSESSYRLVADQPDLHLEEMEPIRVKGKSEPIRIYELGGAGEVGAKEDAP